MGIKYGDTAIDLACDGDHVDIVRLLLERGSQGEYVKLCNHNTREIRVVPEEDFMCRRCSYRYLRDGGSLLGRACDGGRLEVARFLLERSANRRIEIVVSMYDYMDIWIHGYLTIVWFRIVAKYVL